MGFQQEDTVGRARVSARDAQGNPASASAYLWVAGDEYIPWRQTNDRGFALVCEGQLDLIACYLAGVQNVVAPQEIVFENPAHDFPTRISYRKVDAGLVATIDGMIKGKPRAIEFRYTSADCSR